MTEVLEMVGQLEPTVARSVEHIVNIRSLELEGARFAIGEATKGSMIRGGKSLCVDGSFESINGLPWNL